MSYRAFCQKHIYYEEWKRNEEEEKKKKESHGCLVTKERKRLVTPSSLERLERHGASTDNLNN